MADIRLESPDASDVFDLDVNGSIERQVEMSVTIDSAQSSLNQLLGTNITIAMRKSTITFTASSVQSSQYPNSSNYTNHNHGMATELEKACNSWGPNFDSLATLYWDDRGGVNQAYDGYPSNVTTIVNLNKNKQDTYEITIEWTEFDVFDS